MRWARGRGTELHSAGSLPSTPLAAAGVPLLCFFCLGLTVLWDAVEAFPRDPESPISFVLLQQTGQKEASPSHLGPHPLQGQGWKAFLWPGEGP